MNGKEAQSRPSSSIDRLRRENGTLRARLDEAEATLRAFRAGEVDAVFAEDREQVLTLEAPDRPYRLLVDQMPHAAATITSAGTILHANRRLADLLSRPVDTLPGTAFEAFVTAESRDAFRRLLRDGCAADTNAELTLTRDDATTVRVHLGARPLHEGAFGDCVVVNDLTAQRQYEELRHTQEALQLAHRRKDEFVAMLVHELRNPLAPIRNAVEVLKTISTSDPSIEWSRDVIGRQAQIMARLLEDLLDVSRVSLNRLELRKEPIEFTTVVNAALETSRPLIEAGHHNLTIALPEEPVRLVADPVRLAQVFSNLLNNSAKYTEDGGAIALTARVEGATLVVAVKDTGIGIAADLMPDIFEMFSQIESTVERSQGGLGIGLALVKGLVELHGGTVEVSSDGPGGGTEFIVRLPLDA